MVGRYMKITVVTVVVTAAMGGGYLAHAGAQEQKHSEVASPVNSQATTEPLKVAEPMKAADPTPTTSVTTLVANKNAKATEVKQKPPVDQSAKFENNVRSFYSTYAVGNRTIDERKALVRKYSVSGVAESLWATNPDFDPVLCAQNTSSNISYSKSTVHGSTASLTVTIHFSDTNPSVVHVEGNARSGLITSIACPK